VAIPVTALPDGERRKWSWDYKIIICLEKRIEDNRGLFSCGGSGRRSDPASIWPDVGVARHSVWRRLVGSKPQSACRVAFPVAGQTQGTDPEQGNSFFLVSLTKLHPHYQRSENHWARKLQGRF
jgi:hypothetical protein